MKENKLYRVFRALKAQEVKNLRKLMDDPNYMVSPVIKLLYKLLSRQYPDFDNSQAGKEKLFSKLHPDRAYNDLKLRRYFSDLTKIIIDFLNFDTLNEDIWLREKSLIEIYENAKFYTKAHEKREQLHAFLDQDTMKNDRYWEKKMTLYQMEYASDSNSNPKAQEEVLKNLLDASDHYFAYVKIRQALLTKSLSFVFQSNYSLAFLEEVKREHQAGFLQTDSLFKLYMLALNMVENEREDIFFAYESLFFAKTDDLYGEDQLFLFQIGLNFLVRQTNRGDFKFRKITLDWYKFALSEGILLHKNSLDKTSFSNIVTYACQIGEEKWTFNFIAKYIKYLPISIQQDELAYSNAIVYFYQKKYSAIISNISDYSFSQPYIIKTKMLLLCSYFEEFINDNDYFQVLNSNINSFENYLKRNKDWTDKVKKPHLNFCKVLKKLAKFYAKKTEQEEIKKWLLIELERRPIISGKTWLLGIAKNLEKV